MGQIIETLCLILRDGVTLEELALVTVLVGGFVLCVYAATRALTEIILHVTNGVLGIFGTSVRAISEGIQSGGKMLATLSPKEANNARAKTY